MSAKKLEAEISELSESTEVKVTFDWSSRIVYFAFWGIVLIAILWVCWAAQKYYVAQVDILRAEKELIQARTAQSHEVVSILQMLQSTNDSNQQLILKKLDTLILNTSLKSNNSGQRIGESVN